MQAEIAGGRQERRAEGRKLRQANQGQHRRHGDRTHVRSQIEQGRQRAPQQRRVHIECPQQDCRGDAEGEAGRADGQEISGQVILDRAHDIHRDPLLLPGGTQHQRASQQTVAVEQEEVRQQDHGQRAGQQARRGREQAGSLRCLHDDALAGLCRIRGDRADRLADLARIVDWPHQRFQFRGDVAHHLGRAADPFRGRHIEHVADAG